MLTEKFDYGGIFYLDFQTDPDPSIFETRILIRHYFKIPDPTKAPELKLGLQP